MKATTKMMAIWVPVTAAIGMAAGAVVGLLYAPKEGRETRKIIRDKTGEWTGKARDTTRRVIARIKREKAGVG